MKQIHLDANGDMIDLADKGDVMAESMSEEFEPETI